MIFINWNYLNLCTNFKTKNYQKYKMNFFKRLPFILIKLDLLIWKIILFMKFKQMPVKNLFPIGKLPSGIKMKKI